MIGYTVFAKSCWSFTGGIVGAGGNVGAVCYANYLKYKTVGTNVKLHEALPDVFFLLGIIVASIGVIGFAIRFSDESEAQAKIEFEKAAAAN